MGKTMSGQAERQKRKILRELEKVYPCDLSTLEVARMANISKLTADKYLKILEASGEIEVSRKIGRVFLYRVKKR